MVSGNRQKFSPEGSGRAPTQPEMSLRRRPRAQSRALRVRDSCLEGGPSLRNRPFGTGGRRSLLVRGPNRKLGSSPMVQNGRCLAAHGSSLATRIPTTTRESDCLSSGRGRRGRIPDATTTATGKFVDRVASRRGGSQPARGGQTESNLACEHGRHESRAKVADQAASLHRPCRFIPSPVLLHFASTAAPARTCRPRFREGRGPQARPRDTAQRRDTSRRHAPPERTRRCW